MEESKIFKLNEFVERDGESYEKELKTLAQSIESFQTKWGVNFEDFTIKEIEDAGLRGQSLKRSGRF